MQMEKYLKEFFEQNKEIILPKRILILILGIGICSFGIYNIHRQTNITEGGVIGLLLLLNHLTGISASILSPILDILCYLLAFRYLGWDFIKLSAISTVSLSLFYKVWEQVGPILPNLSNHPFYAAILGGIFVGVGVGLVIRQGGSSGGDDALALVISKKGKLRISRAYLVTDITVLLCSLSYIPLKRIGYSFITVTISSLLIDWVQNYKKENIVQNN